MSTEMETAIRKILEQMQSGNAPTTQSAVASSVGSEATYKDYPIAEKHPEWVKVGGDKSLSDITLDAVMQNRIKPEDLRISPAILKAQGEIAKSSGRWTIEYNFNRAAEMTRVPDARLLEMYNALRPYRSSKAELLAIADELQNQFSAPICADFVREAAQNYEKRKKLKGDN